VLLALFAVARSLLQGPSYLLAAFLVLVSGGRALYHSWPGSPACLCQLQLTRDGQLLCSFGRNSGLLVPASVLHFWTLGGRVNGLRVRGDGGQQGSAVLFRDQLLPDQWRQLHLYLRFGRA
jgi:hypothetical protein